MKIKYLGHSCFLINSNDYLLVIDPFKDVNGFKDIDLVANEVVCSHSHLDHAYMEGVKVIAKDNSPFTINKIGTYHDNENGSKRGLNDINIINAEGKRIVHLGDLGHLLNDEIVKSLKEVDVLMIPIGGFYTINTNDALEIVKKINPKIIIPMHYKDNGKGLDVLEDIDSFVLKAKDYQDRLKLVKGYNQEIEI